MTKTKKIKIPGISISVTQLDQECFSLTNLAKQNTIEFLGLVSGSTIQFLIPSNSMGVKE